MAVYQNMETLYEATGNIELLTESAQVDQIKKHLAAIKDKGGKVTKEDIESVVKDIERIEDKDAKKGLISNLIAILFCIIASGAFGIGTVKSSIFGTATALTALVFTIVGAVQFDNATISSVDAKFNKLRDKLLDERKKIIDVGESKSKEGQLRIKQLDGQIKLIADSKKELNARIDERNKGHLSK